MFTFLYWTFVSLAVIASLDYLISRRKRSVDGLDRSESNPNCDNIDLEQDLTNYANEILKRHRQATE